METTTTTPTRKKRNYRPFTETETRFLVKYAPTFTAKDLAVALKRPLTSVKTKLAQLGLTPVSVSDHWLTPKDKDFLKENAKNFTVRELSERFQTTPATIRYHCAQLGVKAKSGFQDRKSVPLHRWTTGEIQKLLSLVEGKIERSERCSVRIKLSDQEWDELLKVFPHQPSRRSLYSAILRYYWTNINNA